MGGKEDLLGRRQPGQSKGLGPGKKHPELEHGVAFPGVEQGAARGQSRQNGWHIRGGILTGQAGSSDTPSSSGVLLNGFNQGVQLHVGART